MICNINCETCDGPLNSDCLTCAAGRFVYLGICTPCHSKCETCSLIPSNCTSCSVGYLFEYDCIPTCPGSYFGRAIDNTCQNCDSSCLTCIDQDAGSCTSCPSGSYQYQTRYAVDVVVSKAGCNCSSTRVTANDPLLNEWIGVKYLAGVLHDLFFLTR